jgi:hypothetical protein
LKVEFADPAREQVRAASAWWRENRRAAPTLFDDELAAVVALLESGPLLTRVFKEVAGEVVRKARLPKDALRSVLHGRCGPRDRPRPVARGARQWSSASLSPGHHGRRWMPYLHAAFAASAQLVVSVHELQSNCCEPTV